MEPPLNTNRSLNENTSIFPKAQEVLSPAGSYAEPSTLSRIRSSHEKALSNQGASHKGLGVDLSKKIIRKEESRAKEASEREVDQLAKTLKSLGLTEDFSIEELSKAMENTNLVQKEEDSFLEAISKENTGSQDESSNRQVVSKADKLIQRYNRVLPKIASLNAFIKQKLEQNEPVDGCFVFIAINLALQMK